MTRLVSVQQYVLVKESMVELVVLRTFETCTVYRLVLHAMSKSVMTCEGSV